MIIKAGQNGSGINDKIWIGKAVVDAAHLSDVANRNGISPIAMSPVFYNNVIEHLCKENEKYKSASVLIPPVITVTLIITTVV